MKKIFLIILSFFILTQTVDSNWDRVKSVKYGAYIWWEFIWKIKTKNTACSIPIEKEYSWNFKEYLVVWNANESGCSFVNVWWKLKCEFSIGHQTTIFQQRAPAWTLKRDVVLNWSYKNILKWFWVPEKLISNVSYYEKYSYRSNVEYSLLTDSNWNNWNRKWTEKDFSVSNEDFWILEYKDESECQPKVCKTSEEIDFIKSNNLKILETITDLNEKEKKKTELEEEVSKIKKCSDIVIPNTLCNSWNCGEKKWVDIITWIQPGKLKSFSISKELLDNWTCLKEWNNFYCYASDNFKLSFEIERTWDGINNAIISVNNALWTWPAFQNNTTHFTTWKNLLAWIIYSSPFRWATDFTKKSWEYTVVLQWGKDWNPAYGTNLLSFKLKIVPNPNDLKAKTIKLEKTSLTNWKIYANHRDEYRNFFKIFDKYWNEIVKTWNNLKDNGRCSDRWCFTQKWWVKSWLNTYGWIFTRLVIPNNLPEHILSIQSVLPWKWLVELSFWVPRWNQKWQIIPNSYSDVWVSTEEEIEFLQPFEFESVSVEWWNINISKEQTYFLKLKNVWNLQNFYDWKIEVARNLIQPKNWFEIKNFSITDKIFSPSDLSANFKALLWAKSDLDIKWENIWLTVKVLPISYKYRNNWIIYDINYTLDWNALFDWCAVNTTWLVINGKSMSKWKENYTSELNTFSNISKSDLKKIIDKNAKDLIRWLKSWEKVNWVLYYEWDVTYSSVKSKLSENDSLIIKNWNLLIDQNVEKNIWIVVLNNNFKPEINSSNKWNIFVKNTVTKIEAYLYSDGGLISAKSLNWEKYTDEELRQHRLDLVWSLISSNTVWGWEKWDSNYLLPWNKVTNNWELAERYDLNYIRKYIITCDVNNPNNYSFKVEYNPAIQSKTPKVFRNN